MQNGVISNVPGPPIPMWVAGAPVIAVYPLGPLIEGAGLNITVISNMGRMDIGIVADRALAPDIGHLADALGGRRQGAPLPRRCRSGRRGLSPPGRPS